MFLISMSLLYFIVQVPHFRIFSKIFDFQLPIKKCQIPWIFLYFRISSYAKFTTPFCKIKIATFLDFTGFLANQKCKIYHHVQNVYIYGVSLILKTSSLSYILFSFMQISLSLYFLIDHHQHSHLHTCLYLYVCKYCIDDYFHPFYLLSRCTELYPDSSVPY